MNPIRWPAPSARMVAPAFLCLALAAIPAAAGACDMQAVNDELAREARAAPPAAQARADADPSPNNGADPSPNDDQPAKTSGAQSAAPKSGASANPSGPGATAPKQSAAPQGQATESKPGSKQ